MRQHGVRIGVEDRAAQIARNMQLVPRGFQNFVEFMVEGFYNFAQSIDRKNVAKFFPLCASIFRGTS
jgi:F0F1-type ATP synthase membrane subunit a